MKIFIPFKPRDTGGTSIFAMKFKKGLEEKGHEVFFEFQRDYDILFVIIQCNPIYLFHAKIHKKKIIHRLDGVYYWSVAKWKYPLLNLAPKLIHKYFSDFSVYQSRYSKYCADKFLGTRKDEKFSIIYNGVDTDLFSPDGDKIENIRDNDNQKIFITVSKFRREDQLIPIIKALEIYKNKYNNNFKLLIIGDFSRKAVDIPQNFSKFTYLDFIGKINNSDLPKYERSADVFLFTHLNPPCPNNILEAMSSGLPICGIDDGAMSELTENQQNSLLLKTRGDAFWKNRDYDLDKFAENLSKIQKEIYKYSEKSRAIVQNKFSLDTMIDNYIKLF